MHRRLQNSDRDRKKGFILSKRDLRVECGECEVRAPVALGHQIWGSGSRERIQGPWKRRPCSLTLLPLWEQSIFDHLTLWHWLQNHTGNTSSSSPSYSGMMLIYCGSGFGNCRDMFPRFPSCNSPCFSTFSGGPAPVSLLCTSSEGSQLLPTTSPAGPQFTHVLEAELKWEMLT